MNPMHCKTPEERKAIAAKSHATRRARLAALDTIGQDAVKYTAELRTQIVELEERIAALQRMEVLHTTAAVLTGKTLLPAEEIVRGALPWTRASGIYFLVDGDEVVYVGQAVNVYGRIAQHGGKQFDRYAFVPCDVGVLDMLESLYIHCLRPKLNASYRSGVKLAPIALDDLLTLLSAPR